MKLNWQGAFYEGAKTGKEWAQKREASDIDEKRMAALERLRQKHNVELEGIRAENVAEADERKNIYSTSAAQVRASHELKLSEAERKARAEEAAADRTQRTEQAAADRLHREGLLKTELDAKDRQFFEGVLIDAKSREDKMFSDRVDLLTQLTREKTNMMADPSFNPDSQEYKDLSTRISTLGKTLADYKGGTSVLEAIAKLSGAPKDFDFGLPKKEEGGDEGVPPPAGVDPNAPSPFGGKGEKKDETKTATEQSIAAERERQNAEREATARVKSSVGSLNSAKEFVEKKVAEIENVIGAAQAGNDPRANKRYQKHMERELGMRVALPKIKALVERHKAYPFAFDNRQIAIINEYIRLYNDQNNGVLEPLPLYDDETE